MNSHLSEIKSNKTLKSPFNSLRGNKNYTTLEQYLIKESKAKFKSEYYNGKIEKIPGSKYNHNMIASNILSEVKQMLKNISSEYKVLNSDQKIFIPSENTVLYPDALVISGKPEFWNDRKDLITNPLVIIEVLSDSTEEFDKNKKFELYKKLDSFSEYIIISQDSYHVQQRFNSKVEGWDSSSLSNIEDMLVLKSIGISVALQDIYYDVEF